MRVWNVTTITTCLLLACPLAAQKDGETTSEDPKVQEFAADQTALRKWLGEYRVGAIRLATKGQLVKEELEKAQKLLHRVAQWNNLTAARLLFEIATLHPLPPGSARSSTAKLDFLTDLRIHQVRSLARNFIVGMDDVAVEAWLLTVAKKKKDNDYKDASTEAGAALRILASRPGVRAKEALLEGCRILQPEVRVQAVNALSLNATIELIPHFFGLVRDKEPYVRIACINGIGRALAPLTDETVHKKIEPKIAKLRDDAIALMRATLLRDRVWQVRSAARENLAQLKTKKAIPALIDGLRAELGRKKDPWSLDIKLHRTLEGLTGLKMALGQYKTWQKFWKNEGATFAFAPAGTKKEDLKSTKYEKFFNLELMSNRVLFVVDFSGSMVEQISLKTKGVGTGRAGGSRQTTKAKLVVEELKKMVLTLKDGDLFNIIVFSDDVRIWKPGKKGKPDLVKINDNLRDELLGGYLDSLQPAGMTNLYGALKVALGLGGRGLHDKYYELGYDTLYVLSDGAPTRGEVTDTNEILRIVKETNALRRLTINTITFGFLNEMIFLKKLALENGGRHMHVD